MARRLLIVNTDLLIGGTPKVVYELAKRLHTPEHKIEVEVACLAPRGPVADLIASAGIHVSAFDADDLFDLPKVVQKLVELIRRRQIDTVLSFLLHANAVAALSSLFCRDVRYFQAIQTTQPNPRWHWWVQSIACHAALRMIVPSQAVARAATQRSGIDPNQITIIPNAVDAGSVAQLDPLTTGSSAMQNPLRLDRPFQIVFLGRLDPIKRVDDLLSAIAKLSSASIHLHICGDGPMRWQLRQLTTALNLNARVTFHGFVPTGQALAEADLLVLPSAAEGFPLVLLEAMASGVPIVATSAPGIVDVVTDEQTALLVPVGDTAALADAIQRCVDNTHLRCAMAEQARALVLSRYTWDRIIPQYQQLLFPD